MVSSYLTYDEKHLNHLKAKDKKLGEVIDIVGFIERETNNDLFDSLINSIIGQQISRKAHVTIYERLKTKIGNITPNNILNIDDNELQSCGLTFRKVEYIKNIANEVKSENLNLEDLHNLTDEKVCERLSNLKGIGKWTAQMLMIFSMGRLDVIAYDDLIIQRGLRMIYHHKKITKQLFEKYKKRYYPYASVASLYLWKVGNGKVDGYKDYAPIKKKVKK